MSRFAVQCVQLSKSFNGVPALCGVTLAVETSEILAVVGPSGCGKSTLLRLIAGFERPDTGEVYLQDQIVAGPQTFVPPERRGVGVVFQDLALFPHLTVNQNIAFGLHKVPAREQRRRVQEILELIGMPGYGNRYPHELSGGERQRVALARTLAPRPVIVLLDEPFSNLDTDLRIQMREEVRLILKQSSATAVFITHDQQEALVIGDRLAVFQPGQLLQVDSAECIFQAPASRFVAEFMGQADFLRGQVTPEGILTQVGLLNQQVVFPNGSLVEFAIRADDVDFSLNGAAQAAARVVERHFTGLVYIYRLMLPSGEVLHSIQPHTRQVPVGTQVKVIVDPGHELACFPAS